MNRLIYKFQPLYKSTIWGGDKIATYKGEHLDSQNIGESWEISAVPGNETVAINGDDKGLSLGELCRKYGEKLLGAASVRKYGLTFPLLIKIIDAKKDLSVQVHPDDELAKKRHNCFGKTEMWFIVETDKDAKINCGLRRALDPADLQSIVSRGLFKDYLASHESAPGDCFFIPAGRVHSIGAGNLLIEIQQSSDITYRIDDFNRRDANGKLRELHLDLAKDAIDYSVKDDYRTHYKAADNELTPIVECQYFQTDLVRLDAQKQLDLPAVDSFRVLVCVDGEVTVSADGKESVTLEKGHSALIAATAAAVTLKSGNTLSTIILSNV